MIPTKESHRSTKKGSSSKASLNLTYNPNRVKSSIPKMNPVVVPQAKMLKVPSQEQQTKYLEEL
jgi:hypothetical protein